MKDRARFITVMNDSGRTSLPQYLRTSAPVVIEPLDAITNWAANSGCTRAVNTTEYLTGGASLKVTSAAGSVGDVRYTPGAPLDYSAAQYFSMWIYIHNAVSDLSASSSILFRFFATADYTGYYTYTLPVGQYAAGRWMRVLCPKARFTTTGSPVGWNNITRIQLRFTAASGIAASVSFDDLTYVSGSKAGVLFRFDDGPAVQYTDVYPLFRSHNMPATLYIPSTYPGTGGYVTWAQLREMQAGGWCIGNHSATHGDLTLLSQADQRAELETCDAAMAAEGITTGKYVAYPLGNWNADTLAAMALAGMLTGADNYAPSTMHGAVPPLDWYLVGSASTDNTTLVSTLTGYIDEAITAGTIVGFHFHAIGGASDMTLANLTQVVDYVVARRTQIYPLTIDQMYRLNSGAVSVPRIR